MSFQVQKSRCQRRRRSGFTIIELLVVVLIIAVLVALLLPAVQAARESSRKVHCLNNVKQLALACLQHEQATGRFPTGGWGHSWTGDADRGTDRRQPGGWIYNVLPFIEQQALHDLGAGMSLEEKHAAHLRRMSTPLSVLYCPTRRATMTYSWIDFVATGGEGIFNAAGSPNAVGRSDYAANLGTTMQAWSPPTGPRSLSEGDADPKGLFAAVAEKADNIIFCGSMVRIADVTDGTTHTYLLGEKCLDPANYLNGIDDGDNEEALMGADIDVLRPTSRAPLQDINDPDPRLPLRTFYRFGSAHVSGFHMAYCDGSVQFMNYSIQAAVHALLGNRKDGKTIDAQAAN